MMITDNSCSDVYVRYRKEEVINDGECALYRVVARMRARVQQRVEMKMKNRWRKASSSNQVAQHFSTLM